MHRRLILICNAQLSHKIIMSQIWNSLTRDVHIHKEFTICIVWMLVDCSWCNFANYKAACDTHVLKLTKFYVGLPNNDIKLGVGFEKSNA